MCKFCEKINTENEPIEDNRCSTIQIVREKHGDWVSNEIQFDFSGYDNIYNTDFVIHFCPFCGEKFN